ncbi:MAG: tetratricopeptide repeat protein [Kofleriaceae bacterium]
MRCAVVTCVLVGLAACAPPPRPLAPLPSAAYAHYLRGRAAFFEGDYRLAIPELELARAAAPDQAGIVIALAQAQARDGRAEAARATIAAAVARFPGSPEAWLAAGELHAQQRRPAAAVAAFARARALDPALVPAYLGLAAAQTQAGDPAAAERTYRSLVAQVPDRPEGHWQLAQRALAAGADAAAEPHLIRVVELDRDHLEARRALAALDARTGRLPAAIAEAQAAFGRSGADLAVGEDLFWLYLEAGDRPAALAVLEPYGGGDRLDDRLRVAALWAAVGEVDQARAIVVGAARDGAGAAGARVAAEAALAAGRLAEAIATADGAAAGASRDDRVGLTAVAAWAELADGARRADAVAARLRQALAQAPTAPALVELEAERLRRTGAVAQGRAVLVAAVRRQPRSSALVLAWADFERRAGDLARARALLDKVLAATPAEPEVQARAAAVRVEAGVELARAGALLLAARRQAPGDPTILDGWGWFRRAIGDRAGAQRAIGRALLIAPLDPVILDHAATLALERGQRATAARLWTRALAVPTPPELAARVRAQLAPIGATPCYLDPTMTMTWLARFAVGSVFVTAACAKTPSKGDCEKLLSHLIDLEAKAGGADKQPKAELDKQKQAISDYAVGQKFIENCTQKTPRKVVACGLAAQDADAVAACDK